MFVSDSTLLMGIKLQILNAEGHSMVTQIDPNSTVESLKQSALAFFYPHEGTSASVPKGEQFRIIHPSKTRTLNESHAIQEEQLQDNDILLFVKRRDAKTVDTALDAELKAPTLAEINAATAHLDPPRPVATRARSDSAETTVDFQMELRKIIISLVSLMATLLRGNTEADLICKEMHARLKHRLAASAKHQQQEGIQPTPAPEIECTPMGIVRGLVEAKRREFRPNQKAVENLREMGFTDEDIISALRACKNNKDQACEWLLGGGGIIIDDIETGLDRSSHLFTALVSNPTVRLGLNCPKTLLAFLGILESPGSANVWLQDADTAPVLSAIFKIYHSEKHASTDL